MKKLLAIALYVIINCATIEFLFANNQDIILNGQEICKFSDFNDFFYNYATSYELRKYCKAKDVLVINGLPQSENKLAPPIFYYNYSDAFFLSVTKENFKQFLQKIQVIALSDAFVIVEQADSLGETKTHFFFYCKQNIWNLVRIEFWPSGDSHQKSIAFVLGFVDIQLNGSIPAGRRLQCNVDMLLGMTNGTG